MSNIPPVVFAGPVIAVVALLVLPRFGKAMMASTDKKYAEWRLGDLSQRLGLQIVEGDPTMNLMQAQTAHNMAKGKAGRGLRSLTDLQKETRIRMEGAPYGRPTQFLFRSMTRQTDAMVAKFIKTEFECRFSVRLPFAPPPFEIVLRRPSGAYKVKPELGLPEQSFGDAGLDGHLVLCSTDPRIGPALAPAMAGLMQHTYLHIQGNGDVISSLTDETGYSAATYYIYETQQTLEHMANMLAGPVTPHR